MNRSKGAKLLSGTRFHAVTVIQAFFHKMSLVRLFIAKPRYIEMITGMMIPLICDGCNLRIYEAAFIGTKYGQPK